MMNCKIPKAAFVITTVLSITALLFASSQTTLASHRVGYEVWFIDQSDTVQEGGGKLYILNGANFKGKGYKGTPEVIDLAQKARGVGDGVGKRPHMVYFNTEQTHAIISNVASGHVYILDAEFRDVVASIRMGSEGEPMRGAHAAIPSPDSSMIIVTNHKRLERIMTDYANNEFDYNPNHALDFNVTQDTTHPDNWIVCPIFTPDSKYVFATLRGGGLYVVDIKSTPMKVVEDFDLTQVSPNGCGGLVSSDGRSMFINSGGGTANHPTGSDLYVFDLAGLSGEEPKVSQPVRIFTRSGFVDSHGMTWSKGGYLWVTDRAANLIEVVDTGRNDDVSQIDLTKGRDGFDPTPDLIVSSPHRYLAFATLRGELPLTGNAPEVHNAVGNSPGLGVIKIHKGGTSGSLWYTIPISNMSGGKETADPHGIALRELRD
jgi:DNA-binding beta-propeller fold protein YncE